MTTEHIYELRYKDNNWHTFYVGRTTNLVVRYSGHKSASKKGTTDVYCFIRDLEYVNLKWDIFSVSAHSKEDYTDEEDMHILECLFANIDLMNMKKGDSKWKERTLANMDKAKQAGCKSVKEFQEWDRVQRQNEREERKRKRIEENKPTLAERIKAKQGFKDKQADKEKTAKSAQSKTASILSQIKR